MSPNTPDAFPAPGGIIGASRRVASNQHGMHPRLQEVVEKHLRTKFRQELKPTSPEVFRQISECRVRHGGAIIFDSGCGTGDSTLYLASLHPDALVVGIDKSAVRLGKAQSKAGPAANLLHVRAELADIWRLTRQAGWQLQHHYLLYPNPWPKKRQLKRRWHAHPVFPDLLALGGILHLRSNWRLYLEEFAESVRIATGLETVPYEVSVTQPISAFEKKYWLSEQKLFELEVNLNAQTSDNFSAPC